MSGEERIEEEVALPMEDVEGGGAVTAEEEPEEEEDEIDEGRGSAGVADAERGTDEVVATSIAPSAGS